MDRPGERTKMVTMERMTPARTVAVTHTRIPSVLGELTVVARAGAVSGLYFPRHWSRPDSASFGAYRDDRDSGFDAVHAQIDEYLAGGRQRFDVPLCTNGDEFQERVWALVSQIPYATTATYGELARQLG